jgi:hypothetical protein
MLPLSEYHHLRRYGSSSSIPNMVEHTYSAKQEYSEWDADAKMELESIALALQRRLISKACSFSASIKYVNMLMFFFSSLTLRFSFIPGLIKANAAILFCFSDNVVVAAAVVVVVVANHDCHS